MKPRDYQIAAVDHLWDYFHRGNTGNPLVILPTGTGKSLVLAFFIKRLLLAYPYMKILCLTHVKELIEQNHEKLIRIWPTAPVGIYSAGLRKKELHHSIVFGGIGSIKNKANELGKVDLVLIDECHLVSNKSTTMYQKLFKGLKAINPNLLIAGLTATDWRMSEGRLTEDDDGIFTDVAFDLTNVNAFNWFINEGYLAPLVPKKTAYQFNLDDVHVRGGEYVANQLQHAVDQEIITENILKEVVEQAGDRRRWLIFATGIEHSIHIAEQLEFLGVRAEAVHSGNKDYKMSNAERDKVISDFKSGKIKACVNNGILTTGFDCPDIDLIVMMRPTLSCGLWVQLLGRGTRPMYANTDINNLETKAGRLAAMEQSPKQDCLVLDFAANTERLGPINDPQKPNKRVKGGAAIMKVCDNCATYVPIATRICPQCNYQFTYANPLGTRLSETAGTNELIKQELPITETYQVDHITYQKHSKKDKPDSLKVSYTCGFQTYTEYVCIEHKGMAKKRAVEWVKERYENSKNSNINFNELPLSNLITMAEKNIIKSPTHLRIWINKKYPEILAACFDGTDFNTKDPKDFKPNKLLNNPEHKQTKTVIDNDYDDIPF